MILELPLLTIIDKYGINEVRQWDWEMFLKMTAFEEFKSECESIILDIGDTGSESGKQVIELQPLPKV